MLRIQKCVTVNQAKGIFGFADTDCIGRKSHLNTYGENGQLKKIFRVIWMCGNGYLLKKLTNYVGMTFVKVMHIFNST